MFDKTSKKRLLEQRTGLSIHAMDKSEQPNLKILMFPWLAHGHIFPFLELSKRLISSTKNATIYLCSTAINLDSIKHSLIQQESSSSINLVQLNVPPSPGLPPELHTTKNLPSNLVPALVEAFQNSAPSFTQVLSCVSPDLLIYDMFQPWAAKLASSQGIPSVYFATSGAAVFSYYHHVHTYGTGSTFPYKGMQMPDDEILDILDRFNSLIRVDDDKDFAFGNFTLSNEVVLMKSCRAVEEKYIEHLSFLSKKRIVPTGPLLMYSNRLYDDDDDEDEFSEIMKWLSMKREGSTVYISFGSEFFLSKDQIAQVAKGLQLCDANFLWVIRFPTEEKATRHIGEELPQGFSDIVRERGKIVPGWAPQAEILAHSSVGGFVSHCGWSSITESMYFGVPIIAMPMQFEQPVNARMVVAAGVAVEVEKDGDGCSYAGDTVAKAINEVIGCEDMRGRAKELSVKIKEEEEEEVNGVAEELLRICIKNKQQV